QRKSALEAGHDLRHVDAHLELHAHVLALLARQGAARFDAHVLGLQDAHDPRQRRADGIGPVARFTKGSAEESFNVHATSWSCGGCALCGEIVPGTFLSTTNRGSAPAGAPLDAPAR